MAELLSGEEPNKKFFYHEHAAKLLKCLNETRDRPNLCDATVTIGTSRIPVQKNILSAASHYFRALFDYDDHVASNTEKSESSNVHLDHMGIEETTFRSILDFIYTAEVKLTPNNIQDMLQAADQLLLADLKDICCEYLDTCINAQNCIGILDFTSQLSCAWWHLKVSQFVDAHFSEVSQYDEFLRLDVARVEKLMARTTIEIKEEDDVLDIILRWYRFDPIGRKNQTKSLMRLVLSVNQLSCDAWAKLTELGMEDEQDFYNLFMELKQEQAQMPFIYRGFTKAIVACGGEGGCRDGDEVEVKDYVRFVLPLKTKHSAATSQWMDLASMLTPRSGHGLVEVGGYLYAAGGRDSNCRILNSCEKFDPFKNCWTPVAPMNHARVGFGFVAIENLIYAIGGSNDMTDPLLSMEVYDVFTNKWKPLPDMIMKRAWACYAAAGPKIYVLGGGIIGKFYESVEVFDTRSLTWYVVSPMRERRCDARAVAVGNDIYVFGGFRRIECPSAAHSGHNLKLCGTEFYSEKNDYWVPIQMRSGGHNMGTPGENSHIAGVLFDGEDILVVGELDMGRDVQTVRSFNRHTNTWECLVIHKPDQQTRYQCCLLPLPRVLLNRLLLSQGKIGVTDDVKLEDGVVD